MKFEPFDVSQIIFSGLSGGTLSAQDGKENRK